MSCRSYLVGRQSDCSKQKRQPKDLVSQKGFGGQVVLQGFKNDEDSAQYVVNCYKNLLPKVLIPKIVLS
jgi:hypothetical protein